jgi:predicted nucleotidyltransferase
MDKRYHSIIEEYKKNLSSLGIRIKKVILYGSYARGKATEESDIDLVVISDDFKNMDLWERLCILAHARIGIKEPMEILGLTENEFNEESEGTFIGDEVKTYGIEV